MDDSVVIMMFYDGSWERSSNGRNNEYVNGKSKLFLLRKGTTFVQLIARVFEVVGINHDDFDISIKTCMKIHCNSQFGVNEPVDILDDEMVNILICMNSGAMKTDGYTPIFVTTFPKVPIQAYESTFCFGSGSSIHEHNSPFPFDENPIDNLTPLDDFTPLTSDSSDVHSLQSEDNEDFENVHDLDDANEASPYRSIIRVDPLQCMPPVLPSACCDKEFESDCGLDGICIGQTFRDKEMIKFELGQLAIIKKFEFKVYRSTKTKFEAHCVAENCNWRFRASRSKNDETMFWTVDRCDEITLHSCSNEVDSNNHRQTKRSKVVGRMIMETYADGKRSHPPKSVMEDLQKQHNVRMSYMQAYRARGIAIELLRGSWEDSYSDLPKYSYVLRSKNPGTVYHLQYDANDRFLYYFLAIGSCVRGFLQCIRPVIAVDGTHLKGKYKGTMFVATCLDGNNQLYPVAIGIGDTENDNSWNWFMMKLHEVIGDVPDMVFIADRHKSIEKAVLTVFSSATFGVCFFHVKGNVKQNYKMPRQLWEKFKKCFIKAAKCYNTGDFDDLMRHLWALHPSAAKYLEEEVGFAKWSRAHFDGRRYSILTTNIAESVNAFMKEARKLPVTHVIDYFRKTMQQWFYERKRAAVAMPTGLSTWAQQVVDERRKIADRMRVFPASDSLFQVVGGGLKEGFVNLEQRECSCRKFQMDKLVCAHAIAACQTCRIDYVALCSHFYKKETLVMAYADPIIPVGDAGNWVIPPDIRNSQVNTPSGTILPGRRKTQRTPSQGEEVPVPRRTYKCSRCGQLGHNRNRCPNPIIRS